MIERTPADRRHLAHHREGAWCDPRHADWRTATLLEDGDLAELRQWVDYVGMESLSAWFDARGARQLSRRSFAFWRLLFGSDARQPQRREELWPL